MKHTILTLLLYIYSCISQASLITDTAGNVLGATNIDINGSLFNVSFIDGPCIDVFSGCNDTTDFLFNSQISSIAASMALINQVFINHLDSQPSKTNGCDDANICWAYTPYEVNSLGQVQFQAAINGIEEYQDSVGCCSTNDHTDLINWETATWAFWSAVTPTNSTSPTTANSVPAPSLMFFVGLGLLIALGQRSALSQSIRY